MQSISTRAYYYYTLIMDGNMLFLHMWWDSFRWHGTLYSVYLKCTFWMKHIIIVVITTERTCCIRIASNTHHIYFFPFAWLVKFLCGSNVCIIWEMFFFCSWRDPIYSSVLPNGRLKMEKRFQVPINQEKNNNLLHFKYKLLMLKFHELCHTYNCVPVHNCATLRRLTIIWLKRLEAIHFL